MATVRRQSPMHIFQDPTPALDHEALPAYDPRYLDSFVSITDVSNDSNTLLAPPRDFFREPSPQKSQQPVSSSPPKPLGEKGANPVSLPPPQEQFFSTDAPAKKPRSMNSSQPFVMPDDPSYWPGFALHVDKENASTYPQPVMPGMYAAEAPMKQGIKRSFTDSTPVRDRSKKLRVKEAKSEEVDGPIPNPDQMPDIEDDGNKPSFSYAMLIGMAILRASNRRLTLAQIYKWISDTFVFYRNSHEMGWQNSIRHNLSLSKSFSKQERPKDDPGKGHYWVINPGFEKQYHKIRPVRRTTHSDSFAPYSDLPRPSTAAGYPQMHGRSDSSRYHEEAELPSSDATIPCSDPAAHDGMSMPPPRQIPSSPPAADIHSSPPPPVSRSRAARDDTPPRVPRFPLNSRSGGRKQKLNGLGDSGYYSSIESSATKGNPLGPLLTSDADLERSNMKRGRAEEEIARIRGSSYDSPTKTRACMKHLEASIISSPFRQDDKLNAPLTPAIVFKRPALPPASASPNTNLRNHRSKMRELVGGSPDKSLAMWCDTTFLDNKTWSPAVSIPNDENVNLVGQGFESSFDIFGEFNYNDSPIKRSARRPRLERAATTTGILADITGTKGNMTGSSTPNWKLAPSLLKIPNLSPAKSLSPLKAPLLKAPISNALDAFPLPEPHKPLGRSSLSYSQSFPAHSTQQQDDDDMFHLLQSDESEPGIDLLQGFEKIGARISTVAPNGSPQKGSSRPSLGRNSTVRFRV